MKTVRDEMSYLLGPFGVKHLQVFLNNSNLLFLMSLIEILQDDGNVHVDDNHEVDNDERDEVDDGHEGMAAVAVGQPFVIWITVGRSDQQRVKHIVPTSRSHQPKSRSNSDVF